ncbi:type IV secretion system DNA-binding domain-containing protein, partial [Candidatus Uhrbacteria bacterium]|nr:type IV secretion system DNA-binding domain-containing protein [Candidatus Uhrbacteria bacterium]
MPIIYNHDHENEVSLFAAVNFRNQFRRFGIKTDDRRRHMYVMGKTGVGKTTLLENLFMSDVLAGHGCCYIDPHGDTAEKLLDFIPSHRINDVVYFNPADLEYPVGFNILETAREEQKHLVASGLMGVFKKIWPDVWSPRMEYILLNCVLALLDYPGATLLGINRLLVDKDYRAKVVAKIRNPIVKTFWLAEFTSWSEKYATEAIAPVQNKVGQFLSASIIRNIVAQVKSTINPREIMDEGKIFIVNLSKGKIGEDNMRLLGGMLVTKIQLAAMERVDIKNEDDRRDFYLFVDEFQNFANQSFASILSEARKYRLSLTVTHQYIAQLEEEVAKAIFGNVGTIACMRVGGEDAAFLETEFAPTFTPEDLVNLPKFQMYLKLMVDGVSTAPFSATTLPPISSRTGSEPKVIQVCRERYAEPRAVMEEKILR